MGKQFSPRQFQPAHVAAIASLVEFRAAQAIMFATTPIAASPSLYERAKSHEDKLYEDTRLGRGHVANQMESVKLDNLVLDELDRRRDHRREVIRQKRAFLYS